MKWFPASGTSSLLDLTSALDEVMRRDAGIEVVDVRVKRIDLPTEVATSVYDRMNSEREIEARAVSGPRS